MNQIQNELKHYGVLGMKWGKRKSVGYTTKSLSGAIARRSNKKVDAGFKKWDENTKKKDTAIDLGKKAMAAKRAYEKDKSNKEAKATYTQANKEYKKALSKNTTYRKGVVKQEVGRDQARKTLSDAKKVKKQLDKNPKDKQSQKEYDRLMTTYNVERAKARRAATTASNRSRKIASLKRARTIAIKGAATAATISVGTVAVNSYLKKNGHQGINQQNINQAIDVGKKILGAAKYF